MNVIFICSLVWYGDCGRMRRSPFFFSICIHNKTYNRADGMRVEWPDPRNAVLGWLHGAYIEPLHTWPCAGIINVFTFNLIVIILASHVNSGLLSHTHTHVLCPNGDWRMSSWIRFAMRYDKSLFGLQIAGKRIPTTVEQNKTKNHATLEIYLPIDGDKRTHNSCKWRTHGWDGNHWAVCQSNACFSPYVFIVAASTTM